MDFIGILTRIFGRLGLVLLVGSYQMKTRPGILGFQIAATFCFCCQFALLGALTGAVMNSIGLVRAILYYFKGRNRFFSLPILPVLMVVVSVAIAAAITSRTTKSKLPTHIEVYADKYGLAKDSVILLEQIRTIDKRRLKEKMGHLDEIAMDRVNNAISVSFGLATGFAADEPVQEFIG